MDNFQKNSNYSFNVLRPDCNANADVESIHATIEEEFYNLTSFTSRKDFFQKAESYRLFYNLERPNFSKREKTPWLIAQEDHSKSNFATVFQSIGVLDLRYLVRFHIRVNLYLCFPN